MSDRECISDSNRNAAVAEDRQHGANKTSSQDFTDPTLQDPSQRSQLLTLSFNQDGGCLAVGTANGFSVHNLHPQYNLSVERTLRGGIGQIEMLFRCNLMALVGGGSDPHAAPHRVLIWDDHVPKEIGELSFRQMVLRVKLRKDAIAVALRDRVYVYHLADLSLRDKIYTADNPFGLLSLSTQVSDMVLACPSVTTGHVRVELYGLRKTMLIEAHESTLRALALTADGTKLATASHKGTIVRVWDVGTSQNIYEFRRGVERASITCLAFSWDDQWLACSSDKGTTHVFYLEKDSSKKPSNGSLASKGTALLSSGGKMLMNSFSSSTSKSPSKSVCQIRGIPHPLACAFIGDAPHLIAVAGWDADGNGVLLISEFAAHQEPRRVAYHVLVKNALTADETEEERRRRRARGWVPNQRHDASEDDLRMHFGHLQISDEMAEESHRFETQTTDDDFCEVIVQPRKEPVIEDKLSPPNSASTKDQPESAEASDDSENDNFVAAKETEEDGNENETFEGTSTSQSPGTSPENKELSGSSISKDGSQEDT